MPLPPSNVSREPLHTRSIRVDSYAREDGQWDLEAELIDTKGYDFPRHSGAIHKAGTPVHHMHLRVTIDDQFTITAAAAAYDAAPYDSNCSAIAPDYEALVAHEAAGAVVGFSGVVRDHDGGRSVLRLEYSAHPSALQTLQEVAAEEYVAGDAGLALHSRMADYFRELADPRGDRTWTDGVRPDRRGLSELPHHLTCAQRWDDLAEVLTDFTFLEQKATHVGVVERADGERVHTGVFALEADYDEALEALGPETGAGERAPLIVTAVDLGQGLVVRCPHCNTVHPFDRACEACGVVHRLEDWRGQDVTCSAPSCGGPLRINAFVVEGP